MFDFHMIDNLSIAVHAFANRILMSFSVGRPKTVDANPASST